MGLLDETVSVPRRTMTLFFLIDTSGSMEGNKIGAVNDAVVNVLPMLNDISEKLVGEVFVLPAVFYTFLHHVFPFSPVSYIYLS